MLIEFFLTVRKYGVPVSITEWLDLLRALEKQLVFADMARIKFDHKQSFATFQQPVLVLQGDQDIISVDTAKKTQNSFPNAQLEILKDCAHYGWLDQPEQYYRALFTFLKA